MSKPVKYGIIAGLVLLAIFLVWYFMKGSSSTTTWTPYADKDFAGQGDIESKPSGTLAADKAYAEKIGAKSFFVSSWGTTYYKSATGVPTSAASGTVYVKS